MKILSAFMAANCEFFGSIFRFLFGPLTLYIVTTVFIMCTSIYFFVGWMDPTGLAPQGGKTDTLIIMGIVAIVAVEWIYSIILWKHLNNPQWLVEQDEKPATAYRKRVKEKDKDKVYFSRKQ